ncbi:MAG: glycosyltransferase family 4 protein [Bacilli bacterium]|nr:glycosyltransferase family 4 protein [Bacilli bacterium]
MNKLRINMLSKADSVDGQGVGSAYLEQVALVKDCDDIFDVTVNKSGSKFDIIHVHTINPQYLMKMNGKHVNVCYVHMLPDTLDGSIKLPKVLFKLFKRYVIKFYRKADEIVVVNPIFINPLVDLGIKKDHITYIPNYVSKDQFHVISEEKRMQVRDLYGVPRERFVVLGVGQVQTRKGVLDFVETARRNPEMFFVWAGGFSFGKITDGYKELKEIVDNPPANVKFTGIVKRDKMNDIFNMSDVLFMPSFNELFPMAILEAVNAHKPVLLRDLDLYVDILFEKYEKGHGVDDFSRVLQSLKSDQKLYQKASKNSAYISEFYSKEHVREIWREYYPRVYQKYFGLKKYPK